MGGTQTLFKSLMNLTLKEFDKLVSQMVPTIKANIDAHVSFFFHIYFQFKPGLIFKFKIRLKVKI